MNNAMNAIRNLDSTEELRELVSSLADHCGPMQCLSGLCPYRGDDLECAGCEWCVTSPTKYLSKEQVEQSRAIHGLVQALDEKEEFLSWDFGYQRKLIITAEEKGESILGYVEDGELLPGVEEVYFPERRLERLIDWDMSEHIRTLVYKGEVKWLKDAIDEACDGGSTIMVDGVYVVIEGEFQFTGYNEDADGLDVFSQAADPMEDRLFNEGVYDSLID